MNDRRRAVSEGGELVLATLDASAGYGSATVVNHVNIHIKRGEIVGIVGRNGVGKTTILKMIIGLLRTRSGSIEFEGCDVTRWPAFRRARAGIGYVPQGRHLFGEMSVGENIELGKLIGCERSGDTVTHTRLADVFPIVSRRSSQLCGSMSGGEQQQVAIARSLVGNPSLLLLDEPSEGIQPSIVKDTARVIRAINRKFGLPVLVVEQNLAVIQLMVDRCYIVDRGRVVKEMDQNDVQNGAEMREYLAV